MHIATSDGKRSASVIVRLLLAINGETLAFSDVNDLNCMPGVAAGNTPPGPWLGTAAPCHRNHEVALFFDRSDTN